MKVEQRTLAGGCPLWLLHRPGPAILSAKLWMRGGSSDDPTGERGAAQLLAGVLSRGCGSFSGDDLADLAVDELVEMTAIDDERRERNLPALAGIPTWIDETIPGPTARESQPLEGS